MWVVEVYNQLCCREVKKVSGGGKLKKCSEDFFAPTPVRKMVCELPIFL